MSKRAPYYECHITGEPETSDSNIRKEELEELCKENGFKFSTLVGDEAMGDGLLWYCTCHSDSYDAIYRKMSNFVDELAAAGFSILREKIELIIFDTKYDVD